ncbi:hypothetical protein ACFQ48_15170 [Hymenobacter caeli]|uniref:Glycosyltransferase RgtA/B/C/D-like domain-containing protein n=1 Tax=Hymenobacter caeli TaxID=2735894 RepID=A0ABX2FR54_9BACT|nr:hypothetical protein [Hymenobacter caeli]NRT19665.1 hypothetical protein [Hymenobacter caeli]
MPPPPPLSASPSASGQFFYVLLLGVLALCAAYAALVLNQATYAEVLAQGRITFHNGFYDYLPVRVSAAGFARAQATALSAACALLLATGLALAGRPGRRQLAALAAETRAAWAGTGARLAALSPAQRRAAGLNLALLTAVRLFFSIVKSYHADEVASYDFFIRRGLLAVSSFYPIPNNHVLSDTLSWLFFRLNPDLWFTLRLPVLLTATAGTGLLFGGLVRFGTFRAALVALTLFAWVQLCLYNAVAGRGYWLLMTLAGVHFFAAVALLARPGGPRVAWATLLLSGVLGCYTLPSFAYVVASAGSYLGLVYLRRRDWAGLGRTAAVAAGVGAGAALLYAPLLLLSGWRRLLANGYVAPRPWPEMVRELPAFAWFTEGTLAGQRTVGALLFLAGLGAFGWLWRARGQAGLAPDLRAAVHRLGPPALWFVLLPYALLAVQRVLPPERVLLYKALYFFALVGLVVDAGLRTRPGRWPPRVAGLGLALFVAYQAYTMVGLVRGNRQYVGAIWRSFAWLEGQPPGRVLVGVNESSLHYLFLAHYRTPGRRWQFDTSAQPGVRYRYVVVPPAYQGPYRPPLPARPAYRDGVDEIYALPAPGRLIGHDPAFD